MKCFPRRELKVPAQNSQSMHENDISYKIIGAALEIHKNIGPGLLESAYENALAFELKELGFKVRQQVPMPFIYKEIKQDVGYRIDLLVNNKVIIEVKAVETLIPVHYAQLLTYLKLSGVKLGLLINFNSKFLKDNIHRVVNNL
jgi:GxxExxY protein